MGMGASGTPKNKERVSVGGDGSGQAFNTSRNVFKTQHIPQARAEDLTAVLF